MKNKNIGVKLNIDNYIPSKSNIKISPYEKRSHKIVNFLQTAGGYIGMFAIGGAIVGAGVSGAQESNNVKKNCDAIKNLYQQIKDANTFLKQQENTISFTDVNIKRIDQQIRDKIGDIQKLIDLEEDNQKKTFMYSQITSITSICFFIFVVIYKVIIARYY